MLTLAHAGLLPARMEDGNAWEKYLLFEWDPTALGG